MATTKKKISKQTNDDVFKDLFSLIDRCVNVRKTAKRNNKSLDGSNTYASKLSEIHADTVIQFSKIQNLFKADGENEASLILNSIKQQIESVFNPITKMKDVAQSIKHIKFTLNTSLKPKLQNQSNHILTDDLFPIEKLKGTRGYIEQVAIQACGAYDKGWFDASAVMLRRLLETLIIECFEAHKVSEKIKKPDGNFFYLRDLISKFLEEPLWNIGRTAKQALPKLKDVGDQSAHNRRFIAHKSDIDKLKGDLRSTVEELLHISKLKTLDKS